MRCPTCNEPMRRHQGYALRVVMTCDNGHDRVNRVVRYVCWECDEPIVGDDPHTASNGEDVHEACCDVCHPNTEV